MAERQQARRKARAVKGPAKPAVDLKQENAALKRELAQALEQQSATARDLQESLEYQTATSDVLRVISRSTFDLQPVLNTLVETAARLCHADVAHMRSREGEIYRSVASFAYSPEFETLARSQAVTPSRGTIAGRVALERRIVHVADIASDPEYEWHDIVSVGKVRTGLGVPLLREGEPVGVITLWRQRVEPFTVRQIELVRTFADQAVIAIENTRLLTETREALERQTATAQVLQIINRSPGDLMPVFEAMLDKALELCGAAFGALWTYDGERMHAAALRGAPPAMAEFLTRSPHAIGRDNAHARLLRGERLVHLADVADDEAYRSGDPIRRALVELAGGRTMLAVPLRKDRTFLGDFVIYRTEVRPFSDKQIALLENFAAQAVIAMENARLLGELRQRTTELARSVDELTATGDVLKIISRSSVDLETVLDTLVETVARLCRADHVGVYRRRDEKYHLVASRGISQEAREFHRTHPMAADRGTITGRVATERRPVHVPDILEDPAYTRHELQTILGFRSMLGVPLLREDTMLGIFVVDRARVDPFTEKEIELATTFADQAVIAIENARLFDELRKRQAELARSVDELTATSDVLKIISRSSIDLEKVLDTLVETAARLCRADGVGMFRRRDDKYHLVLLSQ
jgi:GAF domain-containing protein